MCARAGLWSSDAGGAVTSAPQTGCRKDDRVQTAAMLGQSGAVSIIVGDWSSLPAQPGVHNKMALLWTSPLPTRSIKASL